MKTLGVIANCGKPHAPQVLAQIERAAAAAGMTLVTDPETGAVLTSARGMSAGEVFDRADAVMALGGDGTMLKVVRELGGRDKPVIGLNIGSLGFMTSLAEDEVGRAIECLAADRYTISNRALILCTILRDGRAVGRYHALNEMLVKSTSVRIIMIDVAVDEEVVTSYRCDGLMISTPTGSTGHSLSAGGPIVMPGTHVFVLNLICPHTLSTRPLVIPDPARITLDTSNNRDSLLLSVDGQTEQTLHSGDIIQVRKADRSVRFIHLPGHSYFAVLRQKLRWCGSAV